MTDREPLREHARAIFAAALRAADPGAATRRALSALAARHNGGGPPWSRDGSLSVIAIGKAALAMVKAAMATLPSELFAQPPIAVVNSENASSAELLDLDAEVFVAGHPIPDEVGVRAADRIESVLLGLDEESAVLLLLSGGGSALLPAPPPGVSLADKQRITELLLAAGSEIHELNTVRKHLSRLKGGGFARAAAPAAVEALIVSDVYDDDESTIASGPVTPDSTTFADALDVLARRGVLDTAPRSVVEHLRRGDRGEIEETLALGDDRLQRVRTQIIGSNRRSLRAARVAAESLGYTTSTLPDAVVGEARDAAGRFVAALEDERSGSRALLGGGETTVTLRGCGRGGRNQELALAVALGGSAGGSASRSAWAFLSAGTDGRDGPTDAAGAIVDGKTLARGRAAGVDPEAALAENDSYRFFAASGDLFITGGTGTNVADLQILLTSDTASDRVQRARAHASSGRKRERKRDEKRRREPTTAGVANP